MGLLETFLFRKTIAIKHQTQKIREFEETHAEGARIMIQGHDKWPTLIQNARRETAKS